MDPLHRLWQHFPALLSAVSMCMIYMQLHSLFSCRCLGSVQTAPGDSRSRKLSGVGAVLVAWKALPHLLWWKENRANITLLLPESGQQEIIGFASLCCWDERICKSKVLVPFLAADFADLHASYCSISFLRNNPQEHCMVAYKRSPFFLWPPYNLARNCSTTVLLARWDSNEISAARQSILLLWVV